MSHRRVIPSLAAASLAGVLVGCSPPEPAAFSPKCPEHLANWMAADSAEGEIRIMPVGTIPASGALGDLPEVHDCQRLIRSEGSGQRSYGPLGVLFASQALADLFVGMAATGTHYPARAAATINSWPTGYPQLHLPAGWSCLYIVRMPVNPQLRMRALRAREDTAQIASLVARTLRESAHNAVDTALVWAGVRNATLALPSEPTPEEPQFTHLAYVVEVDHPGRCDAPASESLLAEAPSLAVAATSTAALAQSAQYVEGRARSAARWDGDFGHGGRSQHISIRCGEAWCDVMPLDATGPVPDLLPDGFPADAMTGLKGWYDQQYLAVPGPTGTPGLVPGPTLATYAPVAGLSALTTEEFDRWHVVGYIHLDGASPHYKEKLNLSEGLNTVSLHHGELAEGERPFNQCRGSVQGSDDDQKHKSDPWWVKIESPDGATRYFCSYRHEHSMPALSLPGFVRWRWMDDDEVTWQRCPTGCCPIS